MKTGRISSPMTLETTKLTADLRKSEALLSQTLRTGDRIRATKGPYIKTPAGKLPVGVRGLLTFAEYLDDGKNIRAFDSTGGTVVLHVAGRRKNKAAPEIVCRPYVVTKARPRRKNR